MIAVDRYSVPPDARDTSQLAAPTSVYSKLVYRLSGALENLASRLRCSISLQDTQALLAVADDQDCVVALGEWGAHVSLLKALTQDATSVEEVLSRFGALAAQHGIKFPDTSPGLDKTEQVPFRLTIRDQTSEKSLCLLARLEAVHETGEKANYDVGYRLWGAAVVLSKFVVKKHHEFAGQRILEIGAGVGMVGLLLAHPYFGATEVHLTDFNKRVVGNLDYNLRLNEGFWGEESMLNAAASGRKAFVMDWDAEQVLDIGRYDFVVGSDLICQESDAYNVIKTLERYLAPGGTALITLGASTSRYGVDHFAPALGKGNTWSFEEVQHSADEGELTGDEMLFVGGAKSFVTYVIKRSN